MNVEDMVLLEKIERLAWQAGAAGKREPGKEKKTAPDPFIEKLKVRVSRQVGNDASNCLLYGNTPEENITLGEVRAFLERVASA
jgi:hypothetical protein